MSDEQVTLDMFTTEELELELELRRQLMQLSNKNLLAELQRRYVTSIINMSGKTAEVRIMNGEGDVEFEADDFMGHSVILIY